MSKADLIYKFGLHNFFKPFFSGIGHAIILHRISSENSGIITNGLQVTPDFLDRLLSFFNSKQIDIVSLDECYDRITSKRRTKRFVTITFDDGYTDNLSLALPVFEKYEAPYSVFVTTNYPEDNGVLWWYIIEKLIVEQTFVEFEYEGRHFRCNTRNEDEKRKTFAQIKPFILESKSVEEKMARLGSILKNSTIDIFSLTNEVCLSWAQVAELSNHPLVTIGAHTKNHLALNKLSEDLVFNEINESVLIIQDKINKPVNYFAYPFGTSEEVGNREFQIAKSCNLKMAFTTERRNIYRNDAEKLYSLPRIGFNSTMRKSHFELFISGMTPAIKHYFDV